MQNNNYRRKHLRETSLHQEMKQVFIDWVKGLRPIEQVPQDLQRGDQRRELTVQEFDPDDEARWRDDGGESG